MLSRLELSKIVPNPWRDFELYPIDSDQVDRLVRSIGSTGFWVGVQVRRRGKVYQLAAGHHRVEAARKSGLTNVNAEVLDLDDDQMLRILTAENATQHVNNAAASLDAVAAISKRIAYFLLRYERGDVATIVATWAPSLHAWDIQRGLLISGRGIGHEAIEAYGGLPQKEVETALGVLKDSGRFARIIEVAKLQADAEIEAEADQLEREAAKAEREAAKKRSAAAKQRAIKSREAADASARKTHRRKAGNSKAVTTTRGKRPTVFDAKVAHLFKTRWQLDTFRKLVTADHNRKRIPLDRQYELAQAIIATAKQNDRQVTAEFIRECVANISLHGAIIERRDAEDARTKDDDLKLEDAFNHLRLGVFQVNKGTNAIAEVAKRRAHLPERLEAKFVEHWSSLHQSMQGIAVAMGVNLETGHSQTVEQISDDFDSQDADHSPPLLR